MVVWRCQGSTAANPGGANGRVAMSGVGRSQPWRSQWSCDDVRGRPQPPLEEPMVVWRCQGSTAANPGGANGRVAMSGVDRSQPWRSQWSCGDVRGRPQPTLEEPMVVWRCQGSPAANPGGANGRVAMSGVDRSHLWRSQWSCGDVRGRPQPTLEEPMVVWRCQGSTAANPGGANGRVAMSGVDRSQPWRSQWSCGDVRGRPQPTLEEPMVM